MITVATNILILSPISFVIDLIQKDKFKIIVLPRNEFEFSS